MPKAKKRKAKLKAKKLAKKIVRKPQGKKPVKRRKVLIRKKPASAKATARRRKKIKARKVHRTKKIKTRKIKKIKPATSFPTESLFRAKIKVIGIGGGGGSIVSEIQKSLQKATFIVADTDLRALKKKSGIKYFWFGQDLTHGLGTGVNPELARQAAEIDREKITNLFENQDIVILVASLGGGLGSGAAKVFAQAASSLGIITLGIFTLPFRFEGKNKSKIALKALRELRKFLNVSIAIPNERIFKIIDDNTPITEAFSVVNKNLIGSLESLIDLIYNPGLINIDFADLKTILKGSGNLAFLNVVEESGKDRAEKIAEKILFNPLYQNNNFTVEKILFNISGGQNLNMFEVQKISNKVAELNPRAKIIFGISKIARAKNKIKTTILMTGPQRIFESEILKKKEPEKAAPRASEKPVEEKKEKTKKIKPKRPQKKIRKEEIVPLTVLNPAFNIPVAGEAAGVDVKKLNIVEVSNIPARKTTRRNAIEIKKAEALEEKKRLQQEKEWEIPAFLRRVKS